MCSKYLLSELGRKHPCLYKITERRIRRREFVSSALALSGMTAAASFDRAIPDVGRGFPQAARPCQSRHPFRTTSSIWGNQHDVVWAIQRSPPWDCKAIEPYANNIEQFRKNPLELKKMFDEAGVTLIDVSNGAKRPVDEFHRQGSDPQNHCRPRGLRSRFPSALRLRPL